MISPKVVVEPVKEAISMGELKGQCRIPQDDYNEDYLLEIYRQKARKYVEKRTVRTIHDTTLEWTLDAWPCERYIVLPRATPLIEIVSVKLKDSDAVETTWSSAKYVADTDSIPGRLVLGYNESWPSFTKYPVSAIRIRYRAGIATTNPETEAPADIKHPVMVIAAGLYENREPEVIELGITASVAIQFGVEGDIQNLIVDHAF